MPWAMTIARFLDARLPHVDVVYQVARHAVGAGQEPEDLVQETYLRAYAAFGSYRGQNMPAWLAAICLNAARSEARPVPRASAGRGPPSLLRLATWLLLAALYVLAAVAVGAG